MRRLLAGKAALVVAALSAPAFGQDEALDCAAPTLGNAELEACTRIAYDLVEAELDETYRLALVAAEAWDDEAALRGTEGFAPVRDLLEQGQSAWNTYAEATCAAEGLMADDDTPVSLQLCYIRLSERRIGDLRRFGETD